ncbi:nucleotidyl transferase AbiEii/AbiGii toxin family protein, partial [Acinetobacter nosocomialis]|uniref:nucleotidyl transferase AbiEii/AbiGii toxin family protein n=1 Tax=Acinetobacter nosocomialis TaxID=106654 RepID=UPI00148F851B
APDLVDQADTNPVPETRSQGKRWTEKVRERLLVWVKEKALPTIEARLAADKLTAKLTVDGDKLQVTYVPLEKGNGYVSPTVTLEFGARSTGEPSEVHDVT